MLGVEFRQALAEASGLAPASVDLVTVAQALHWFDLDGFYAELRSVLRPGGVIAVWTYGLTRVNPAVDEAVMVLYRDLLGGYWPPERAHVENGYADLDFPFEPIPAPGFAVEQLWTLDQFCAYLETWSALQRYRDDRGQDPLGRVMESLIRGWGGAGRKQRVRWPLSLKVGRKLV